MCPSPPATSVRWHSGAVFHRGCSDPFAGAGCGGAVATTRPHELRPAASLARATRPLPVTLRAGGAGAGRGWGLRGGARSSLAVARDRCHPRDLLQCPSLDVSQARGAHARRALRWPAGLGRALGLLRAGSGSARRGSVGSRSYEPQLAAAAAAGRSRETEDACRPLAARLRARHLLHVLMN